MLSGIVNLPVTPRIEKEEDVGNDNRYKLVLLHREAGTYTVIGLPYGADLVSRLEVPSAIYLKANRNEVRYQTLEDPTFLVIRHRNQVYLLVNIENEKRIIPYKTREEFPVAYTDNQLYSQMQEHTDNIMKKMDELFRGVNNNIHSKDFHSRMIKEMIDECYGLAKMEYIFPRKVYSLIEEAFSEEPISSSRMTRLERNLKHWHLKDLNIKTLPDLDRSFARAKFFGEILIKEYLKRSILHPILPTVAKRNYASRKKLKNEISRKRNKEMIAAIREIYPELFRKLKKMNSDADNSASKAFKNLTLLVGGATMFTNLPAGLGIISYGLLDRYFSKRHAESEGVYTGLIGQIRDCFIKEELRDFYFFDVPEKGHLI